MWNELDSNFYKEEKWIDLQSECIPFLKLLYEWNLVVNDEMIKIAL